MIVLEPNSQDREWDLIYKAVADLNGIVSGGLAPNSQDRKWDLLYKLTTNVRLVVEANGGDPDGAP